MCVLIPICLSLFARHEKRDLLSCLGGETFRLNTQELCEFVRDQTGFSTSFLDRIIEIVQQHDYNGLVFSAFAKRNCLRKVLTSRNERVVYEDECRRLFAIIAESVHSVLFCVVSLITTWWEFEFRER